MYSKSQFRGSHRREACEDTKKKIVAQELKMKFSVVVNGDSKVLPAQKPVVIRDKLLSIQATVEMKST